MEGLKGNLSISTLNVWGLRNKKQRKHILFKCRNKKYDVIAVQESHLTNREKNMITKEWGDNFHFSAGTNRSKGLITLFGRNIKKEETELIKISDRMIISKIKKGDAYIHIVNVYGPCIDSEKINFVDCFKKEVENLDSASHLVTMGDFNIVMNNKKDIISGLPHDEKIVKHFNRAVNELGLVDIWRMKNFNTRTFSWSKKTPSIARRLDYVFMSESLLLTIYLLTTVIIYDR